MKNIQLDDIISMIDQKLTYAQIAQHYGVNQGTIYNMIKRDKAKRFKRPIKMAQAVIKQHLIKSPPINLTNISKKEGFSIFYQKLPHNISGIIENTLNEKNIFINKEHMPTRQRFSLAHELGHHFLDHFTTEAHKDTTTIFRREGEVLPIDREANRFAAELLMPSAFLRKEIALTKKEIDHDVLEDLARTFQVSVIALTYRLQNLNFELL
ncbi:MAG: ImmA/IrrE family metallo-endopeptidase [Candidatus Marinamargulisbacteria bacterium]